MFLGINFHSIGLPTQIQLLSITLAHCCQDVHVVTDAWRVDVPSSLPALPAVRITIAETRIDTWTGIIKLQRELHIACAVKFAQYAISKKVVDTSIAVTD